MHAYQFYAFNFLKIKDDEKVTNRDKKRKQ
jgi:hypothetical protein